MTVSDESYPKPNIRDWALLAIGIIFVICGVIILPSKRDVGIVSLAMFGPATVVAATIILRKLRFRRQRALKAEIAGGVPIRQSRVLVITSAATLFAMGVVFILFGKSYGPIFLALAWLVAAIGGGLLISALLGWWPNDSIQFDPKGITFGRTRYTFMVPWEAIAGVCAGHYSNNPAAFIWLHDNTSIVVHPVEQYRRALKHLAWNAGWTGAPIFVLTSNYGMDLPLFMMALERYLTDPATRAELALRQLPNKPSNA
jgi:hypothetical protein